MRLVVRVFGLEVLSVSTASEEDEEINNGPPFGFSASSGGVIERSEFEEGDK